MQAIIAERTMKKREDSEEQEKRARYDKYKIELRRQIQANKMRRLD